VKKSSAWLIYTVLRLAAFIVPLAIMLALRVDYIIAGVLSAIIGLCVSYIFFAKWRSQISEQLYASRQGKVSASERDENAEDAEVDASTNSARTAAPQTKPAK
jgi:hypothetical protein